MVKQSPGWPAADVAEEARPEQLYDELETAVQPREDHGLLLVGLQLVGQRTRWPLAADDCCHLDISLLQLCQCPQLGQQLRDVVAAPHDRVLVGRPELVRWRRPLTAPAVQVGTVIEQQPDVIRSPALAEGMLSNSANYETWLMTSISTSPRMRLPSSMNCAHP